VRIAQLAPLYEDVPPRGYGGTERVVSYLTEELVRQGHDVTLFASGDSQTSAQLCKGSARALRLDPQGGDPLAPHIVMAERLYRRDRDFDVIHAHIDFLTFPFARRSRTPTLSTLHGRLDLPYLVGVYEEFGEQNVVSISDAQRAPLPWLNWRGTVHHGLPLDLYRFHPRPDSYVVFIGRISPEKRVDRAIEIAERAGIELRIAAKIDKADAEYFHEVIEPLLRRSRRVIVGTEVDDAAKDDLIGNALALLFPIDWPEPFGLILIEAMACGTPVIAWRGGSVPEVIEHGVTGWICENIPAAVEGLERIGFIHRTRCRQEFEHRFTVERMARDYLAIYQRLMRGRESRMRDVA